MPNSDHRSKVTIEDLLRLKKSERPAADFWSGFERELRQKQLSALVEKRAWWHDLPRFFSRRAYLPIGATAILTFTLISVKYYTPLQVVQTDVAPTAAVPTFASSSENAPAVSSSTSVSSPLVNKSEQLVPVMAERTVALASVRSPAEPTSHSPSLAVMDSFAEDSPSARSIAANFARLEQSEPELINSVLGSRLSSHARLQTSSAPVVELASLQMNGGKRTRLLAHYNDHQLNAEPSTPDAVRERVSRRLDDSDFNDRFTRIGLKGDQVSLKF